MLLEGWINGWWGGMGSLCNKIFTGELGNFYLFNCWTSLDGELLELGRRNNTEKV